MELTAGQRRTFDTLIRPGRAPPGPEVIASVRAGLEAELSSLGLPKEAPVRLSKGRVDANARCEGWFDGLLRAEGAPFAYGPASAAGTLAHRAIQLDIASERSGDVRAVVERAAERLAEGDRAFGRYWQMLDALDRAERLSAASAHLALFRDMFPAADRSWQPVSEQYLAANLAGRSVVLSGRIDLILGRGPYLLIDFKNGQAWPGHAEDMRFYALLVALLRPTAPYRVATVFLESMDWQAEEVTEEVLLHAAGRVAAAVRTAADLARRNALLTPGPHCRFCPRARTCPASLVLQAGA